MPSSTPVWSGWCGVPGGVRGLSGTLRALRRGAQEAPHQARVRHRAHRRRGYRSGHREEHPVRRASTAECGLSPCRERSYGWPASLQARCSAAPVGCYGASVDRFEGCNRRLEAPKGALKIRFVGFNLQHVVLRLQHVVLNLQNARLRPQNSLLEPQNTLLSARPIPFGPSSNVPPTRRIPWRHYTRSPPRRRTGRSRCARG
jgi:hypothetical protein